METIIWDILKNVTRYIIKQTKKIKNNIFWNSRITANEYKTLIDIYGFGEYKENMHNKNNFLRLKSKKLVKNNILTKKGMKFIDDPIIYPCFEKTPEHIKSYKARLEIWNSKKIRNWIKDGCPPYNLGITISKLLKYDFSEDERKVIKDDNSIFDNINVLKN